MAALNAASISKFVVSSKTASSAWRKRGRGTVLVALVAAPDIGQHFCLGDADSGGLQLAIAAPRALLRGGGDEQLHVGIGADDGADVAAVEHGAGLAPGESALIGEQRLRTAGWLATMEAASPSLPSIRYGSPKVLTSSASAAASAALASAGLAAGASVSRATAR